MTLTVRGEGVPPTAVEHSCMCRADRWPSPGDVLPVTLDARKPKRLKVEWDEVESARDRAWSTATAMASQQAARERGDRQGVTPEEERAAAAAGIDLDALRQAFPGATIDVESHTIGAAGEPDRIATLERLAKLRESGALSDAEFEAEKARILRGD
jgi:hypothetical protein